MQINKLNNINFKAVDRKTAQNMFRCFGREYPGCKYEMKENIARQFFNPYFNISINEDGRYYVSRSGVNPDLGCAYYYKRDFCTLDQATEQADLCRQTLEKTVVKQCLKNFRKDTNIDFVNSFENMSKEAKRSAQKALDNAFYSPLFPTIKSAQTRKLVMEQAFNLYYEVIEKDGKWYVVPTKSAPDFAPSPDINNPHDTYEEAVRFAKAAEYMLSSIVTALDEDFIHNASDKEFLDKYTV